MYDYIVKQIGDVDQSKLERNRVWIKENIFQLEKWNVLLSGKNYLKIFLKTMKKFILQKNRDM